MNFFLKLQQYIIKSRQQIAKFFVVGLSSALIDISLVVFLKEVAGFRPVFAVATSQAVVITYNFLLNKYWSFSTREVPLKQFTRFIVNAIFNYFASILLMYVFYDLVGINYKLVRLGSIAFMSMLNFFIYKHWVYKEN